MKLVAEIFSEISGKLLYDALMLKRRGTEACPEPVEGLSRIANLKPVAVRLGLSLPKGSEWLELRGAGAG